VSAPDLPKPNPSDAPLTHPLEHLYAGQRDIPSERPRPAGANPSDAPLTHPLEHLYAGSRDIPGAPTSSALI
jgi:hypothetical protein